MLRVFFLSALVLFSFSIAYPQVEWKQFDAQEQKFKANFPGSVKQSKDANPPEVGGYFCDYKSIISPLRQLFAVRVIEDPDAHSEPTDEQLRIRLNRSRDSAVSGMPDGKLISERDIRLDGRLGREFVVENKSFLILARAHYFHNRLYLVTAMTRKPQSDKKNFEETATRFLNSFVILH